MRKKLLIIGGILFVLIMVIGLTAGNSPEVKKNFEAGREQAVKDLGKTSQPNQTVYTLEAKATVENNKIRVRGTANLPDGALVDVNAYRLIRMQGDTPGWRTNGESKAVDVVSVLEGSFVADVLPDDKLFSEAVDRAGYQITKISPDVRFEIVFDPRRTDPTQAPEVLQTVGNFGENLKTSQQVNVIGEKTDDPYNQLKVQFDTPFAFKKQ